ncbi:FixH family protein [Roseospira visakhapatnamensis]|uniref:Nitrogen fixation protein FixH n=1 Tax=Roseospira visakhapatnamensis TaxID=390880 RepID=A0A7W6RCY1_9PROT|nr:FixH family protein [Roseospira visakhapatnamensis]MBB4265633.1 nitrogen fixation protein FixH [Roseospira visakhapatnamensis]
MRANSIPARPRGWWIPYTFVGGFAVVLVANLALLYFATTTFSGLTTRQAYVEGLAYNDRVAEDQAQAALGWTLDVALSSEVTPLPDAAGRAATLRVTAEDAGGRPLDGLVITALVRRPTQQGLDQTVTLAPVGPGAYRIHLTLPKPGVWDLVFTARRGDETFRLRRRLNAA